MQEQSSQITWLQRLQPPPHEPAAQMTCLRLNDDDESLNHADIKEKVEVCFRGTRAEISGDLAAPVPVQGFPQELNY